MTHVSQIAPSLLTITETSLLSSRKNVSGSVEDKSSEVGDFDGASDTILQMLNISGMVPNEVISLYIFVAPMHYINGRPIICCL